MTDLSIMAWLITGEHMTKALATLTYARFMSHETVYTALLAAVLNGVDIWDAGVLNSYIIALC